MVSLLERVNSPLALVLGDAPFYFFRSGCSATLGCDADGSIRLEVSHECPSLAWRALRPPGSSPSLAALDAAVRKRGPVVLRFRRLEGAGPDIHAVLGVYDKAASRFVSVSAIFALERLEVSEARVVWADHEWARLGGHIQSFKAA